MAKQPEPTQTVKQADPARWPLFLGTGGLGAMLAGSYSHLSQRTPEQRQALKAELLKSLGSAAVAGLGLGATYGGVNAMRGILGKRPPKHDVGSQVYDPIMLRRPVEEEKTATAIGQYNFRTCTIQAAAAQLLEKQAGVLDALAKYVPDFAISTVSPQHPKMNPFLALGAIPLAAGTFMAGRSGVEGAISGVQTDMQRKRTEEARKRYQQAVQQQFAAAMQEKNALDVAYDKLCKQANSDGQQLGIVGQATLAAMNKLRALPGQASRMWNSSASGTYPLNAALGTLLTIGGLVGANGLYQGYLDQRKSSPAKIMEQALAERRRQRGIIQPLYAVDDPSQV